MLLPLGEVPHSDKGGAVGNFELLLFDERHPLSQPLRAASSPTGELRAFCTESFRENRLFGGFPGSFFVGNGENKIMVVSSMKMM